MGGVTQFITRKRWQVAGLVVVLAGAALSLTGDAILRDVGLLLILCGLLVSARGGRLRLAGQMGAGVVVGLLFFTALIAMMLAGLREPYVLIFIVCGAVAVAVTAYIRATRARRNRNGGSFTKVP